MAEALLVRALMRRLIDAGVDAAAEMLDEARTPVDRQDRLRSRGRAESAQTSVIPSCARRCRRRPYDEFGLKDLLLRLLILLLLRVVVERCESKVDRSGGHLGNRHVESRQRWRRCGGVGEVVEADN